MSLFQTSVVKKYLNDLSPELIDKKYTEFQTYFGNLEIQQNIRESKEEEYQSGFITALFVNIFGYTLKPELNYNFVLEKKNIDDSKKADGAILKDNEVIAVIELKSTQTTDLDTVETQAFGYKNHNPKCQYIITSNFEKIRLYIQNAIDYIEFDLFNLSREEFALLWLCFLKDNILQDIPLKLKEASVLQEENVTKKLYNDYSNFRRDIFNNIVKNNPEHDKLVLFKKTQKLLDRFLFIFFAEDRLLLPPNSISEIVKQWTILKEDLDEYVPLYDRFKKYFGYLNTGYKGKKYDIFPYNGGLFAPDLILDNIKVDDEILHKHTVQLSTYDFETEVDVNILGHIFEHSLGEIENVQAEIKGEEVDKQKTKRKKDGIFYTPKYITKYIVENTVGKLCEEKRNELEIIDEEYAKGRKNRKKDIVRALDDKLTAYRDWLLDITILDPACGSGAFLNQALEFLILEHKKIDELKFQLLGGSIVFPDVEAKILEKNIYGVDLNEESVEIAKLSLWLRTAQKGRKLTTLSNHIKCGNSLIDDPEIAGEKAFNWTKEFPEVFKTGGFDVIIGNPPYFSLSAFSKKVMNVLKTNYINAEKNSDIYCLFYELGIKLLRNNGLLSYITSNQWLQAQYGKVLRDFIIQNSNPIQLLNFGGVKIFSDATVDSSILTIKKESCEYNLSACLFSNTFNTMENISNYIEENSIVISDLKNNRWFIIDPTTTNLRTKIIANNPALKNHDISIKYGIKNGFNEAFFIDSNTKERLCKNNPENLDIIKPLLRGRDIHRYYIEWTGLWLIATLPSLNINIDNYPLIKDYLKSFGKRLEQTGEKGSRKKTNNKWFETQDTISYYKDFYKEKIIYPETTVRRSEFYLDTNSFFIDKTAFIITGNNLRYYQAILSSKLLQWFLELELRSLGKNSIQYSKIFIENTPIPFPTGKYIKEFNIRTELIAEKQKQIIERKSTLISLLESNYQIDHIQKNFASICENDYKTFIETLKKLKIKITISEQAEWKDYFDNYKKEISQLQFDINKTDREIDRLVYELYGLTEEEIAIVENS